MSLATRRFLYIFFIILFLTITPLILLYAAGYSFASGFKVQKTGILIADTKPSDAKIAIDGKTQKNIFNKIFNIDSSVILTPAKIKNLIPGEYEITLSKENYWDWKKKLTIKPGESTYIEDVSLFKKDTPLIIAAGTYEKNVLSPGKEYLAIASKSDLALLNIKTEEIEFFSFGTSSSEISELPEIIWSPNSKNLIFGNKLFNIKNWQNPTDLDKIIGANIKQISWSDDNDSLYYLSDNILRKFNISEQSSEEIFQNANLSDYEISDTVLYYLENSLNAVNIIAWDIKGKKQIKNIGLPFSAYSFLTGNKKFLSLYDKTHQILYLIDFSSTYMPLRESISNIELAEWINEDKLLYANKHEIWLFDLNNRKNTLLTRISQEITDIIWHPSDNYVLYATPKDIFTIELDDREKYNITRIIELNTIKNLLLNKEGDTLYFYSKIGNQEGVYKLMIQ